MAKLTVEELEFITWCVDFKKFNIPSEKRQKLVTIISNGEYPEPDTANAYGLLQWCDYYFIEEYDLLVTGKKSM